MAIPKRCSPYPRASSFEAMLGLTACLSENGPGHGPGVRTALHASREAGHIVLTVRDPQPRGRARRLAGRKRAVEHIDCGMSAEISNPALPGNVTTFFRVLNPESITCETGLDGIYVIFTNVKECTKDDAEAEALRDRLRVAVAALTAP